MYDINGNLSDWWMNYTSQEFDRQAKCLISEYGNFTTTGPDGEMLHLGGQQTIDENVGPGWRGRSAGRPARTSSSRASKFHAGATLLIQLSEEGAGVQGLVVFDMDWIE